MMIFARSHDLMNEWARRYNNRRYYFWAEKLMLCRNWASQKKPNWKLSKTSTFPSSKIYTIAMVASKEKHNLRISF